MDKKFKLEMLEEEITLEEELEVLVLDPDSQACPLVKVGDRVKYMDMKDRERQGYVKEMRYNDLQQGTCRSIEKLQLLYCGENLFLNPANTLTVDCKECPIERGEPCKSHIFQQLS